MADAIDFKLSHGFRIGMRRLDEKQISLTFMYGAGAEARKHGPIVLSTAKALQAAKDVRKDLSSPLLPIVRFAEGDAVAFADRLTGFLKEK